MGEQSVGLQNEPVDVSEEFGRQENHFFAAAKAESFDPASASGELLWRSFALKQRVSYHQLTLQLEGYKVWEDAPPGEYEDEPAFPFALSFYGPRTVRLRVAARPQTIRERPSLMVPRPPQEDASPWELVDGGCCTEYRGPAGTVAVSRSPWRLEFRDASGRLLTRSWHVSDKPGVVSGRPTPFSFVRNAANLRRHLAASFSLSPGERLFGGGESFTALNKRGQKLVLWTRDAYGTQSQEMYKPVPFFLSSRGYGMFAHTSHPLTLDLGSSYDGAAVLYLDDDFLDLFFFLGSPNEVLSEYTALTGRAPTPPLWSFGLWMGRESYSSEQEVREVARKLREERIPSDVIHLDVGWTEVPHRNDFRFSPSRFPNPQKMLSALREEGFRVSLWQLPYFNPKNELHAEAIEKGFMILSANGEPPVDDAVIDLSNPEAVRWYQEKLANLLKMGVGVFTADFGEAAPLSGIYSGNRSGFEEHNLYPLRYNRAVAEITKEVTGESVIYARSAWAGSQRYPLHWGGDAEVTDGAMAATLRGGLSLGLCGFSFWSHFIGGFSRPTPPDLYLRWLAFGVFCSHARCHGAPPTEPWEYGEEFTQSFRRIVEMRYRLMPYVYAQARECSERGFPMVRPLFFEYPEDRSCWTVEDEYLFGEDLLVAPLVESGPEREVYLPPGRWFGYPDGQIYEGSGWLELRAREIPIVVLVREGAAVPHAGLARHTGEIRWDRIELKVFGDGEASGLFCRPQDVHPHRLRLGRGDVSPEEDPSGGEVRWSVTRV